MNRVTLALAASLYLAACTQAPPPADPAPAAPAEARTTTDDTAHDDLRRAVQAPIDKARAVEQTLQEDADATAKAIEDAGG